MLVNIKLISEISCSHGDVYEGDSHVGYGAV
jgi:hypothetical protein